MVCTAHGQPPSVPVGAEIVKSSTDNPYIAPSPSAARMRVTMRASVSTCLPPGVMHPPDASSHAESARQGLTQHIPKQASANGMPLDQQQEGGHGAHCAETWSQQDGQGREQAAGCRMPGGTLSSADAHIQGRLRAAGFPQRHALPSEDRQPPRGQRGVPLIPVLEPIHPTHAFFVARHLPGLQGGMPCTAPSGEGMTISVLKARCATRSMFFRGKVYDDAHAAQHRLYLDEAQT